MSETLNASIALQLIATLKNVQAISTPTDAIPINLSQAIASGTAAGQANKIFRDRRTLASGASERLSMYDFGGALSSLGVAFAQSKVLALLIYNRATVDGDDLVVGGDGTSAAWTSLFNGSGTATQRVKPGGYLLLIAPDTAGMAVVSPTNHLLKIANASGANAVAYDIVVIGAQ
jgi:hypothetical protein